MTYRQSEMYNCAKYLKNLPLQSVSSKGNLQVVDHLKIPFGWSSGGLPPEDSLWMKQTVVVSF